MDTINHVWKCSKRGRQKWALFYEVRGQKKNLKGSQLPVFSCVQRMQSPPCDDVPELAKDECVKEEHNLMDEFDGLPPRIQYDIQLSMGIIVINDVKMPPQKIHVSGSPADVHTIYMHLVEKGLLVDKKAMKKFNGRHCFLEPTAAFLAAYDRPTFFHYVPLMPKEDLPIVPREVKGTAKEWYDLYMKRSHEKQRRIMTWPIFVSEMRLPPSWAFMSF